MQQDSRRWLWWLAVGAWIAVVFGFSSDGFSAESTSRFIEPLLRWIFPELSGAAREQLHFLVRKGAHAFEYAVLAALAYGAQRDWSSPARSMGFALALVFAVAIADETHQRFAASRTGSAADVSIDVAGGLTALLLLAGLRKLDQMRRPQHEPSR